VRVFECGVYVCVCCMRECVVCYVCVCVSVCVSVCVRARTRGVWFVVCGLCATSA
jgi:hypothetical protein